MTHLLDKEQLLEKLKSLDGYDPEKDHVIADDLLIEFINDEDIKIAYDAVHKWYS